MLVEMILGGILTVVAGVVGLILWVYVLFPKNRVICKLGTQEGEKFTTTKTIRKKISDESFDFDGHTYLVDFSKITDRTLYYVLGESSPLSVNTKAKVNAALLYQVLKTRIYSQVFDEGGMSTADIIVLIAVAIGVCVTFYGVYQGTQLQTEIMKNRALLENITATVRNGGIVITPK